MSKLTLISFPTCPYVQRAIIALKEKGQSFDVQYVDLANKPDWFLALSPLGKVPVLKVERPGLKDAAVFESSVIVEYLEEATEGPKLHPADPLERAQHRAWMEFGSSVLGDLFKFVTTSEPVEAGKARDAVVVKLRRLESTLGDGPFFAGSAFSCVDAVFAPVFRQIDTLETVINVGLTDGLPKVDAWRAALAVRPSVISAVPSDYTERFLDRLKAMDSAILKTAA